MDILEQIDHLTRENINEVVDAVLDKYKALFPDWEIATFSICKTGDRNGQIDNIINLLENLKTSR